jgi:hypothetical protein
MFGRKKPEELEEQEGPPILMATVEAVPWPYEVLGLVAATSKDRLSDSLYQLIDDLEADARAIGADAIIAVRFNDDSTTARTGSAAYGTAVRRQTANVS